MTPTILGEGFANFGWVFGPVTAVLLFCINLVVILVVMWCSRFGPVLFSGLLWSFFLLPLLSMTNGLGSFMFNYFPKGLIAACATWVFYKALLVLMRPSTRRRGVAQ